MGKVIVYRGANEMFRWRLVDDNDVFVSQSELLPTADDAITAGQSIAKQEGAEFESRLEGVEA